MLHSRGFALPVRLLTAVLPRYAHPGQTVPLRLTIINEGYAAPAARPVQIILRTATSTQIVPIPADTRTWAPGATVDLVANFTAPTRADDYKLYLSLPDPNVGLATQQRLASGEPTNAAYSIRLANYGVWEGRYGWNSLRHLLTVA